MAVDEAELPALAELQRRGTANCVPVRRLDVAEAREDEPQVRCIAALRVDSIAGSVTPARRPAGRVLSVSGRLASCHQILF